MSFQLRPRRLSFRWNTVKIRLHGRSKLITFVFSAIVITLLSIFFWIHHQVDSDLARTRKLISNQEFIAFEHKHLGPIEHSNIQTIFTDSHVTDVTRFQNTLVAATTGGLVQIGNQARHFTLRDGLPEHDLTCLAVFHNTLWIGTEKEGLMTFDGVQFEHYTWPNHNQHITALLADAHSLLIGTQAGGLIAFDGLRFTQVQFEREKHRFPAIECLSKIESRLYVGTYSEGLWVQTSGRWQQFTTSHGLPSDRVVGIAELGEQVIVATDFGLASVSKTEMDQAEATTPNLFHTLATLPGLASLTTCQGKILMCQDNGALSTVVQTGNQLSVEPLDQPFVSQTPSLSGCRVSAVENSVFLNSDQGLWKSSEITTDVSQLAFEPIALPASLGSLTSNQISALEFDADGNLWAGTFRDGIDVLSPTGKRMAHLESDALRDINQLVFDPQLKVMWAATSNGLMKIDALTQMSSVTTRQGLLSDSVNSVFPGTELVVATSDGLSTGKPNQFKSLTRIQGLPGNSVYCVLQVGRSVFVGTGGGLAEVQSGKVIRVWTDSNSHLTHNWVSALAATESRLFIGTYGGGVFELLPSGDLHAFDIGKQTVNPNALMCFGNKLGVGTLDGAWILDLDSQKWTHLSSELPSSTVLSLTATDEHLYVGTDAGIVVLKQGSGFRVQGL
ncbi:MAG: hypothetical protein HY774_07775 [Acidobacteria bacterium]|nr:hypothetical protein [Acidobacteriota bacterium]